MNIDAIVFFDLDGTLCPDNDLQVPPEVVAAFSGFRERRILPIIASGRSLYEVRPLLKKLNVDSYILANGCYVVFQGTVIQDYRLPAAIIEEVVRTARRHNQDVGFFNQAGYAVTGINSLTKQHIGSMKLADTQINPDFYQTHGVNFLNIYLPAPQERIYQDAFNDRLAFVRYAPLAVDVLPFAVSKSQAIDKLLAAGKVLGIPTYAFGDQNNDLSMFANVDYGIAMNHATAELQGVASYVAATDSGVLEGLRHYQLC